MSRIWVLFLVSKTHFWLAFYDFAQLRGKREESAHCEFLFGVFIGMNITGFHVLGIFYEANTWLNKTYIVSCVFLVTVLFLCNSLYLTMFLPFPGYRFLLHLLWFRCLGKHFHCYSVAEIWFHPTVIFCCCFLLLPLRGFTWNLGRMSRIFLLSPCMIILEVDFNCGE